MSDVLELCTPCAGALKDIGPPAAAGVIVRAEIPQIVHVIARGAAAEISDALKASLGLALPEANTCGTAGDLTLVATGPRTWLALRDSPDNLQAALRAALGESVALTEQSSGYALLRISGPKARATFEKGLGVDLHPRVFRPGSAAATACAHLNVVIWQTDDAPTYRIAVARSFAGAFCHWLTESAAEFGISVSEA